MRSAAGARRPSCQEPARKRHDRLNREDPVQQTVRLHPPERFRDCAPRCCVMGLYPSAGPDAMKPLASRSSRPRGRTVDHAQRIRL
jgi:hypothetical protein